MRRKFLFLFLLSGALFMASCNHDEVDDATLSLSELSLEFPKDAAEKNVTVTTNKQKWVAISNAEWIEVSLAGQTLTVKTKVNTNGTERSGAILVTAGGASETIHITQSASDIHIAIAPDKLEIDQWGGERIFDVDANTDDWTVDVDADWITLTPKLYKKEVLMKIAENTEKVSRTAKITINANNTLKEFTVVQSGIMFFILPYLNFGGDIQDIIQFEQHRNSDCTSVSYSSLYFITKSPLFSKITYGIYRGNGTYVKATLEATKKFITSHEKFSEELNAFLTDNGFKPTEYANKYVKEAEDFLIKVQVFIDGSDVSLQFTYTPYQTEKYDTFDGFPYGLTDFNANKEAIISWEEQIGGVYNSKESVEEPDEELHYLWFDVKNTHELLGRAYFIYAELGEDRVINETMQYYVDMNLCFWQHAGQLFITKEFDALMTAEGFEYEGDIADWQTYIHEKKNLVACMRWSKYTDLPSPVVDLRVGPLSQEYSERLLNFNSETSKKPLFSGK